MRRSGTMKIDDEVNALLQQAQVRAQGKLSSARAKRDAAQQAGGAVEAAFEIINAQSKAIQRLAKEVAALRQALEQRDGG